jgi:hypothetical protein
MLKINALEEGGLHPSICMPDARNGQCKTAKRGGVIFPMPKPATLALPDPAALIVPMRRHRVIFDADLAALHGVSTRALNQAAKRNAKRSPDTFAFQVSFAEWEAMRSQNVTASKRNARFLPWVFTEHGALMAANVLNSERAILMSVELINAFIRLREMALSVEELAGKVDALERGFRRDGEQFQVVFDALRQLPNPPEKPKPQIAFHCEA